jgi:toxin ParE1/3/4
MARLAFSPRAYLDIEGVLTDLTAKAGRLTALKYDGLFERLYARLARHPGSGAGRPILGEHVRIGVVAPFIVIYRYSMEIDTETVLRVVDGRRRISGRLLSRKSLTP